MRLKQEFVVDAAGNQRIATAAERGALGVITRNNETAAFIVDRLERDTTPETIIADMYAECDAPIGVVAADVERILSILRGLGALEE